MKMKECLAINDTNKDNIKIFNLDTDDMIELNEEASLIFMHKDEPIDSIKKVFCDQYDISDETQLVSDIKEILAFLEENLYE